VRYHGWVRIVCPSCAAAYDVPEAALAPGRAVRCARCGTEWAPLAAAPRTPLASPQPLAPPRPAAWDVPERVTTSAPLAEPDAGASLPRRSKVLLTEPAPEATAYRPRRRDAAPLLAWLASLALLLVLLAAAYTWRDRIMTAWPPSERLYAALGLARAASTVSH
jgi:predicted Zn finger-like uncharacterized protein